MNLTTERSNDSAEPASDGMLDYEYVGTRYVFEEGESQLILRRYDDDPTVASFLDPMPWDPTVLETPLFRQAFRHLQEVAGVRTLRGLGPTGTFVPVANADCGPAAT